MEVAVQSGKILRNISCFHLISWRQQKKTLFPWNVRDFQLTITQWGSATHTKHSFCGICCLLVWLQVRRHRCIQSLAASRCTRIPEHKSSQSSLLIFDLVYHGTVESYTKAHPRLVSKTHIHTHTYTPVRRGLVAYKGAGCNSRRPHCGEAHQAGGRRGEARWGVSVGQHFVASCRRHAVVVLWVTDWPGQTGRGGKRRRIAHVHVCIKYQSH